LDQKIVKVCFWEIWINLE